MLVHVRQVGFLFDIRHTGYSENFHLSINKQYFPSKFNVFEMVQVGPSREQNSILNSMFYWFCTG